MTCRKAGPWGFSPSEKAARGRSNFQADDTVDALLSNTAEPRPVVGAALATAAVSATPASPTECPEHFGRFRVVRALSHSPWGDVFEAIDERLHRRVAIKARHSRDQTTFRREARLIAAIRHPGIVTAYEFGITDTGLCYLVCEWLEGQTLAHLIAEDTPPVAEAVEIIAQSAEALDFAHRQGIIHRDVKPSNILLDARHRPRIADFGLALHETEQRSGRDTFSGTPAYMAPEQISGPSSMLDGRCDVWALGVILYQLLTGQRPFHGESCHALFEQILAQDPEPLRWVARPTAANGARDNLNRQQLEQIVGRCLERQPIARYATAAELAADLRGCLEPPHGARDSVHHADPTTQTTTPMTLDGNKSSWWLSTGVAILSIGMLVAAAVWSSWSWSKPSLPATGAQRDASGGASHEVVRP